MQIDCTHKFLKDMRKQSLAWYPCVKLNYKISEVRTWTHQYKKGAIYRIYFSMNMTVLKEYLVYDFVAMLGAVGGTLGFCVGFSLYDLSSFVLKGIEFCVNRMVNKRIVESEFSKGHQTTLHVQSFS